jgi:hypothetical protein
MISKTSRRVGMNFQIARSLLHIVKISMFYLRCYGQNCPYCHKIEEIYKKKNSCFPITLLLPH